LRPRSEGWLPAASLSACPTACTSSPGRRGATNTRCTSGPAIRGAFCSTGCRRVRPDADGDMKRRLFLGAAAGGALSSELPAAASIPVIDTHIHLFDTARPQGVPWPEPGNTTLYRPALPERYRKLAVPLGVKGAVVVEA